MDQKSEEFQIIMAVLLCILESRVYKNIGIVLRRVYFVQLWKDSSNLSRNVNPFTFLKRVQLMAFEVRPWSGSIRF